MVTKRFQYIIHLFYLNYKCFQNIRSCTQLVKQRESSVKSHRWVLETLHVEWRNSTSRFAWTLERRKGNIHLNTYFISWTNGGRAHNQSRLQSPFVPQNKIGIILIFGIQAGIPLVAKIVEFKRALCNKTG